MPRAPKEHRIDSAAVRAKLTPRGEPYWRQIAPGLFLGYRRPAAGCGAWIVRTRASDGGYDQQRIASADDVGRPDGEVVLSYGQAQKRAQAVAEGATVATPRHHADGWTVDDCIAYYLAQRQKPGTGKQRRVMKESGRRNAEGFWRTHGADLAGKPVRRLNAEVLSDWHAAIASKPRMIRGPGGTRRALPFDPSDTDQARRRRASANRVLTVVKAALALAWRNDKLPGVDAFWQKVQPFTERPEDADQPPRMLDHDEIRRLLNAAAPDLRRLLSAALHTGCRYGELCTLRVRDFDPENATVRVAQHKVGKPLFQPLAPEGAAFFDGLAAGRKPDEFLLLRANGRPWQRGDQARPMREAITGAGLEDVTFKATRATYGKLLLLATRDLELVAKALGHADSRITRRHYAQLLPNEVAAGIALLPRLGTASEGKVRRLRGKR